MAGFFVRKFRFLAASHNGAVPIQPAKLNPIGFINTGNVDDLKAGLERLGFADVVSPSACFRDIQQVRGTVERYLVLLPSLLDHKRVIEQLSKESDLS